MKYLIEKFGKINTLVLFFCIIFLILELIGHRYGETSIEDILFFPAIFGFFSCLIIFVIAIILRPLLMKDEDYYDE